MYGHLLVCVCYIFTHITVLLPVCMHTLSPAVELVVEPPEDSSNGEQQTLCS